MSGEERLPEKKWKRVGALEPLWGRRSEEMTELNASSPWGQKYLLSLRGGDGN